VYDPENGFSDKTVGDFFDEHPEITPAMKIELLGRLVFTTPGWGEDAYDTLERVYGDFCAKVEDLEWGGSARC
jgi:hypothetical protein